MTAKKYISIVITIALMLSLVLSADGTAANAAGRPGIRVSAAECNAGDIVTLTVSVENNPGICAMLFEIRYDSGLTLLGADDSGLFTGGVFTSNLSDNPYRLSWEFGAEGDSSANGTIATLRFKTAEGQNGKTYNVSVLWFVDDIVNSELDTVDFVTYDGVVKTSCMHNFGEYVANNDATCTVDGTKTATCTICGATDTITDTGTAIGHSYADPVVKIRPVRFGADGEGECTCRSCGDKKTVVLQYVTGDINWDMQVNGKDDNMLTQHIIGDWPNIDTEKGDIYKDDRIDGKDGNLMKQIIIGDYHPDFVK